MIYFDSEGNISRKRLPVSNIHNIFSMYVTPYLALALCISVSITHAGLFVVVYLLDSLHLKFKYVPGKQIYIPTQLYTTCEITSAYASIRECE